MLDERTFAPVALDPGNAAATPSAGAAPERSGELDDGGERRRAAEHAIWRILASSDDLGAASARILEAVCRCAGWALGELWRVDGQAGVLRLEDLWHQDPSQLAAFVDVSRATTFVPGVGLPGRVWASRAPAWVEDVVVDPNFPRAHHAAVAGLHGAFAFPIKTQDRVQGVMSFYSREFRAPDEDLLESLEVIGGQIGHCAARLDDQAALLASEARHRALFEQLDQAVIILRDGLAVDCNPATVRLFGLTRREELLGKGPGDFAPPRQPSGALSLEEARRLISRALQGESLLFEWRCLRRDGSELDTEARLSAIQLGDERLLQCILTDISVRLRMERELRAALEQVHALTLRDELTGTFNRRHLDSALAIEVAAALRHHQPLSLAIFDVDHFKAVNDEHGHLAGDAVLRALASRLSQEIRTEDILARYGGEEFVLVMRNTTASDAWQIAERLRVAVASGAAPVASGASGAAPAAQAALRVTVSCGVASLDECSERTGQALLRAADERLYAAKTQGRDRVVGA